MAEPSSESTSESKKKKRKKKRKRTKDEEVVDEEADEDGGACFGFGLVGLFDDEAIHLSKAPEEGLGKEPQTDLSVGQAVVQLQRLCHL